LTTRVKNKQKSTFFVDLSFILFTQKTVKIL
jgi:hypothetical protein